MEQAIVFSVTFVISQLVFLVIRQRCKIKELERQKNLIERSKNRWDNYYRGCISSLENQVNELMKIKTKGNANVSSDTIQAVKYAMKHAHPDNGGNSEDFIKFKKLYEELTNK